MTTVFKGIILKVMGPDGEWIEIGKLDDFRKGLPDSSDITTLSFTKFRRHDDNRIQGVAKDPQDE